ncbi:MAG: hypothetical protein K8R46_09200, partial [Pirellulales bacterium]|nr:hypothetical protein [Pirellulales bacterium]
ARATKDAEFRRETAARSRELEHRKSRFRPVEAAIGVLVENPDDAEANLTVGKWRCFTNGDWHHGLPLLAKGSDAELAALARRDFARPMAVEDQMSLADAWYAAAAKEQPSAKAGALFRCCYWYEQVLPKLSGLDQTRVRKRIDELYKKDIRGEKIRGIVVKGNVALTRKGATVVGPAHGNRMLDGDKVTREKDSTAISRWPCRWTITLDRVYWLREIRFRLYDFNPRAYRYVLSVSSDGDRYTTVKDASKGGWSSWQQVCFSPRPVKTIVLEGLHNNKSEYFSVVELEAYCIPPKGM